MASPQDPEDLEWLRQQGVEILISLTEEPPPHRWVEDAGLLIFHVPMVDMEPPTLEQLDRCISAIRKAHEGRRGVAVHCGAGLGRTGVVLACYFVAQGEKPDAAVARVRGLRPGSVETAEQLAVVSDFARHLARREK